MKKKTKITILDKNKNPVINQQVTAYFNQGLKKFENSKNEIIYDVIVSIKNTVLANLNTYVLIDNVMYKIVSIKTGNLINVSFLYLSETVN